MKRLVLVMMVSAIIVGAQANVIVDPGFETTALGVVPDGGAPGVWNSWNGDYEVSTENPGSGLNSAKVGVRDLVNYAGDKYSNLRNEIQVIDPSLELDNTTWNASALVYYDETNVASTDAFSFSIKARDNWNTATVQSSKTILGSDLVSGQWNLIELSLDIPAQGLDPLDAEYNNKLRNRIGVQFDHNGWTGQTGIFFVDDVSLSVVPEPLTMALLGLGGLFIRRRA